MKVLLAKAGLDGHDRGVKVVRDALVAGGVEVVYIGLHKSPEETVEAAVREGVDAVGISSMTGAHNAVFPRLFELLKEKGLDIPVFAGGVIPDDDILRLKEMGVKEVFLPATKLDDIVGFIKGLYKG